MLKRWWDANTLVDKKTSVTLIVYSPTGWRVQRECEECIPERVVYCDLQLTSQPQQTVVVGQFTVTRSGTHDNDERWMHRPRNVSALLCQLVLGAVADGQNHRSVVEVRERTEMTRVRLTGLRREIDEQMELALGRWNSNKNNNKQTITLTTNYISNGW